VNKDGRRKAKMAQDDEPQRNRLKLILWDGSGLWIRAKKLSKGRFRWPEPQPGEVKVVLSHEELAMLLGGLI
jgi:transposase